MTACKRRSPHLGCSWSLAWCFWRTAHCRKGSWRLQYLGSAPPDPGLWPEDLLQTNTVTLYITSCSWLRFQPCALLNIIIAFFSVLRKQDMVLRTSTPVVPEGSQLELKSPHSCLRPSFPRIKAAILPATHPSSTRGQKRKEWVFYSTSLVCPVEPRAWSEACWDKPECHVEASTAKSIVVNSSGP